MLKSGLAALKTKISGRGTPLCVHFSVTNRCASNCVYCYCEDDSSPDLDIQSVKKLIAEAASAGCRTFWFLGGEPLLRDDIIEIVRYAKGQGLVVCVASNGHLLHEKRGILDMVDHLCISLDGPEAMHDANRGAGSFSKAMRALETASGKTTLATNTVITKNNLGGIDFVIARARELGALANFVVVRNCPENIRPDEAEQRGVIARLITAKKKGAPVSQSFDCLNTLLAWPDYGKVAYRAGDLGYRGKCLAGRLYCYVHHNGDVYRCNELAGNTKPLNFLEAGFKAAFRHLGSSAVDCGICNSICFLEMNRMYSLNRGAIFEHIKNHIFG